MLSQIAICQENLLLVSDQKIQEEEVNVRPADDLLKWVQRDLIIAMGLARAQLLDKEEEEEVAAKLVVVLAVIVIVTAVLPCPQGRERQSIRFRLMHKKYTVRLTIMHSNSIQAHPRGEVESNRAKNRWLTESLGLQ
jgi:hypothetical protein